MSDMLARNALYVPRSMPRARERRVKAAGADLPVADPLSRESVERRLITACKTIRALPDAERKHLYGSLQNSMWAFAVTEWTAYGAVKEQERFYPDPADVSDVLTALAWVRAVSKAQFKLVWARSFDVSFAQIGLRIGRGKDTARQWYRQAIDQIHEEALKTAKNNSPTSSKNGISDAMIR